MSFTILFPTLTFSALLLGIFKVAALMDKDWGFLFHDDNIFPAIVVLILYFFVRAQRTFYGAGWSTALLRSVLMFLGFAVTIVFFRFTLFVVTYWMV
jgi:hypothetical protein